MNDRGGVTALPIYSINGYDCVKGIQQTKKNNVIPVSWNRTSSPQYDHDKELEKLSFPFRISPRTNEFGRIKRRTLTTRNISTYAKKDFRVSGRKETRFIETHVWQTVIPKSLQVYQLR